MNAEALIRPAHPGASLLRDGSFVRLCTGQFVSAVGDKLSSIAIAVWVVAQREDGVLALGAIFAVRTLAASLLLIVGGAVADRVPRRAQVIASQLLLGALMAALSVMPIGVPLPLLLVFFGVVGATDAFLGPASQVLVMDLAGQDRLRSANSITTLVTRAAGLLGPALGGILVTTIGIPTTFLVDAGSFGIGALAVLTTRPVAPAAASGSRERGPNILVAAADGVRLIAGTPWLRTILASDLAQTFFAVAPFFVLLPVVLLPRGTNTYALTVSAFAAGGVIGGLIPLRWNPRAVGRAAMLSQALFALPLAVLALDLPSPAIVLAAFAGGVGADLGAVLFLTGMQRGVPGALVGRVTAASSLGSIALLPAGFVLAGALANAIGPGPVLAAGTVVVTLATAAALRTPGVTHLGARA